MTHHESTPSIAVSCTTIATRRGLVDGAHASRSGFEGAGPLELPDPRRRHEAAQATVLLHFPAARGEVDLDTVAGTLSQLQGVDRVERGRKLRHVMLVDYDPDRLSAAAILVACRVPPAHPRPARRSARRSRPPTPVLFPAARPPHPLAA